MPKRRKPKTPASKPPYAGALPCADECGSWAEAGFKRCERCRLKRRDRAAARRAELIEAGFCRDGCGREANAPAHYCEECYERNLARNAESYRRRASGG